jgi:hypothetical protein
MQIKDLASPSSMTASEKSEFRLCEQVISRHKQALIETADALRTIRDKRLYRDEFKTFENYCQERWGFNKDRASQLITAKVVLDSLPKEVITKVSIQNERQIRAISQISGKSLPEVLKKASENGRLSAAKIEAAAREVEASKPDIELDQTGRSVPDGIRDEWRRAESTARRLRALMSEVKVAVEKGTNSSPDRIWSELSNGDVSIFEEGYAKLGLLLPYAVCTTCQGRAQQKCKLCHGRGWLSKFRYRQCVPAEVRALAEKRK